MERGKRHLPGVRDATAGGLRKSCEAIGMDTAKNGEGPLEFLSASEGRTVRNGKGRSLARTTTIGTKEQIANPVGRSESLRRNTAS